jgi:hypothetical protein
MIAHFTEVSDRFRRLNSMASWRRTPVYRTSFYGIKEPFYFWSVILYLAIKDVYSFGLVH